VLTANGASKLLRLDRTRHTAFVGGYGAGKTFIGCYKCLMLASLNMGCYGAYVAPTYVMMRDIIWRTFDEVLHDNGIEYELHKSEWRLEIPAFNANVLLRSADRPERLKGLNLAWCGLDEAAICSKEAWNVLLSRVRDPDASHPQLFITTTPEGFNWVYEEFDEKAPRDEYAIHYSPTSENKHLPPEYIESLRASYDEKLILQYEQGRFVNVGTGAVYFAFDRHTHVKENAVALDNVLHIGLDFNVSPMLAECFQVRPDKTIVGVDEFYIPDNASTDMMCNAIKARYHHHHDNNLMWLYPDAAGNARKTSGKSDWAMLKEGLPKAIIKSGKSNPRIKDRVNSFNRVLKSSEGVVSLYVSPKQAQLIKDLEQVVYNDNGEIDKTKDARRTHASDAAGYFIENLRPIQERAFYA